MTRCSIGAPTRPPAEWPWWLDRELAELEPAVEVLFAEVDAVLSGAARRWPPRCGEVPVPRPRRAVRPGDEWAPRRPDRARDVLPSQRGPPVPGEPGACR